MSLIFDPVQPSRLFCRPTRLLALRTPLLLVAAGGLLWTVPAGTLKVASVLSLVGRFLVFAGLTIWIARITAGAWMPRVERAAGLIAGMNRKSYLGLLVSVAFGLRLGFAIAFPDDLTSDAYWYHARAIDLMEGRGYVRPGPMVNGESTLIPTAFWPVGYSAFLSAVYRMSGPSWRAGILVNVLLSGASIIVLYRIGTVLYQTRCARVGALLAALSPVLWPRMLMAESLLTFLLMLALWGALAWRIGALSTLGIGLCMAAAVYVKVNALPFLVMLAGVWSARAMRLRIAFAHIALCVLTVAIFCLPWAIRNAERLGAFVPTTTSGGVAMLMGADEHADGREPTTYAGPVWARVLDLRLNQFDEVEANHYAYEQARLWREEHPIRWTGLGVAKLIWFQLSQPWQPPFALFGDKERFTPNVESAFKTACRVSAWLTSLGAAFFLVHCARSCRRDRFRERLLQWAPLMAWLCFAVQAFIFVGDGRLRVPVEGLLVLAAAYALLNRSPSAGQAGQR